MALAHDPSSPSASLRPRHGSRECDELVERFDECLKGVGAVAVLTGAAGSGKSSILRAFLSAVTASGGVALSAVASQRERHRPLGVIDQLLLDAPATLGGDRSRAALLGVAPARPLSAAPALRAVYDAPAMKQLWNGLEAFAAQTPLVLAVDDVEFIDRPSLDCLRFVCSQIRDSRVLLVVTHADSAAESGSLGGGLVQQLIGHAPERRIPVSSLSPEQVSAQLAEILGADAPAVANPEWASFTGGNPLLVRALAEDHLLAADRSQTRAPEPVPGDRYGQAYLSCLRRADPRAAHLVRATAVLESSSSMAFLPAVAEMPLDAVGRLARTLESGGLLHAGRLPHARLRQAVLTDTSSEETRALHRRAADLLYRDGVGADKIAVHLVAAEDASEPWALDILQDASRSALRADDIRFAARCLDLAYDACVNDDQQASITMQRARIEWRNNPGAALRHIRSLTVALSEGRLAPSRCLHLVKPLLWQGRQAEAIEALERLTSDPLAPQASVEFQVTHLWLRSYQPSLLVEQPWIEDWSSLVDLPSATASPGLGAMAALSHVMHHGPSAEAARTATWALEALSLDDATLCPIECALYVLIYVDQPARAVQWCDRLMEEAGARAAATWTATLGGIRAEAALRQGDLPGAERYARDALAAIPTWSWGVAIGSPLATLILATTAMGTLESLDDLDVAVPESMFDTRYGAEYLYARGQLHLAQGHLNAALEDLLACGRMLTDWGVDVPAFLPWRSAAVEAFLRLGCTREAATLAAEQLERPGADRPRTRGIALRALAATAGPRERLELLKEATEALQGTADRVQLAWAHADLGESHHERGDARRARTQRRRAAHLAEQAHAWPLHRRLSTHATSGSQPLQGAPDVELSALSSAEVQVASLAAAGLTNREIARKLYITTSTVEQHLTRSYRKLGVSGRADLPPRLAQLPLDEPVRQSS